MSGKVVVTVIGPTAVGKTDLTIALAKEYNCQIISADSRQFYREMNIGTAKPTVDQLNTVKHHFINSHSVRDSFSAGNFEVKALESIEKLHRNDDLVILTGGSGLYINALLNGLPDIPETKPEVREQLNNRLKSEGLVNILKELEDVDSDYFHVVDKSNPMRVIRGLEVFLSTGQKFSSFKTSQAFHRPFTIIKIGLNRDREELYERINERVDQMVEAGLFEEVKSLMAYEHVQALQTVGYKEVFDYIHGKQAYEETIELIKRNTRRYAKRQLTWFRKDDSIHWFHPDDYDDIERFINSKM